MNASRLLGSLLCLGVLATPSYALPGQRTETVAAWIAGNPALRPTARDGLTVKRTSTAAQRFEFRASIFPPGLVSSIGNPGTIRSETFSIVDRINGVSQMQLEQSLREIYGLDIYQDYLRGQILHSYHSEQTLEMSRRLALPGIAAQRGEIRLGEGFAYWVELTSNGEGEVYAGQLTVLLMEDVEKLERELILGN
ncbi:hypothetical protein PN462_05130 [Spirulina sp. CS-785/01]|uniref:hypothetical protein n=1 Tax=Spirulina sp. CS-785/01 TaxID=3021716 RepID=UPI00232D27F6|nr:hypothetical protein [Spirulina sp. CS-785/01]MDB9312479.1 hypothetical protein [Spirulina sp. CS-785/01]